MNDNIQIYQEYLKIKKIIKSSYDFENYNDPELYRWLNQHYRKNFNGTCQVYTPISTIRSICQNWVDRVIEENKISRFNHSWMDLLLFWFKGKYKERKRFLQMFYAIYMDMTSLLDELDGGPDQQENNIRTSGFRVP